MPCIRYANRSINLSDDGEVADLVLAGTMKLIPGKQTSGRLSPAWLCCAAAALLLCQCGIVNAQPGTERLERPKTRCIPVEVYVRNETLASVKSAQRLRESLAKRAGVIVTILDLGVPQNDARFQQICKAFRVQRASIPLVYSCRQIVTDCGKPDAFCARVEATLRMTVFVREGCQRCTSAKRFLPGLLKKYPGLEIKYREIVSDAAASDELNRLTQHYRTAAASVPVFHFCNQLVVGFDRESTTGKRLDQILTTWTLACPEELAQDRSSARVETGHRTVRRLRWRPQSSRFVTAAAVLPFFLVAQVEPVSSDDRSADDDDRDLKDDSENKPAAELLPLPLDPLPLPNAPLPNAPLPLPGGLLPIPDSGIPPPMGDANSPTGSESGGTGDSIDLPVFGELSARAIGLPLFTIAVGLVDGFNPCAMWVLLFLLSVLVNLHDRWKIVAVAGTFVCISGIAYFAFMAAWLNVFLLVGLLRWVQVVLGCLAVGIGSIHIKDFFAFKQGLSLSIPESAKPGLYARVRRIVTAESLMGAIAGASVLAVLVNVIELLCTAGLPAMYTQILTMHELPAWQNYAYLLLYNLAYMFDDGVMVGLVVVTLGRRKMQERHGRWLKLLSGVVIAALGVVMILKPEWLG